MRHLRYRYLRIRILVTHEAYRISPRAPIARDALPGCGCYA